MSTAAPVRCSKLRDGRVVLGLAGLIVTGLRARRPGVGPLELAAFRAVNDLPEDPSGVVWALMQCGSLGAVPAAAGLSRMAGHQMLARRLLVAGGAAWLAAKVAKQAVRRPRPADLVPGVALRGSAATGLGYLSGHAGVVTALATVAAHELPPGAAVAAWACVPVVAGARVYAGAHLPLDVLGGAALGLSIGALVKGCGTRPRVRLDTTSAVSRSRCPNAAT